MLYKKLKELRKEIGITQEQLAKVIQVERSSIGKYESPKANVTPSNDVLKKIAKYFNVPISFLLGEQPFEYWDDIEKNKQLIIDNLLSQRPEIYFLYKDHPSQISIINLINMIDATFESIIFTKDHIDCFPRIPLSNKKNYLNPINAIETTLLELFRNLNRQEQHEIIGEIRGIIKSRQNKIG